MQGGGTQRRRLPRDRPAKPHPRPTLISPAREKTPLRFNVLFLIFSPPCEKKKKKKMIFQTSDSRAFSQDLVHLKTCGKPCGMSQMIPRCGPQTGLTHSCPAQRQRGGGGRGGGGFAGRTPVKYQKTLSLLSVCVCCFQSIGAHWGCGLMSFVEKLKMEVLLCRINRE